MPIIIAESRIKTMYTYDAEVLKELLGSIIQRHISPDTWNWINERKTVAVGSTDFNTAFAAMPRKTGKSIIQITDEEQGRIQMFRPGFTINDWSIDRLCRVWLLMNVDPSGQDNYFHSIDHLFLAAEMNELVALYSSIPLLAYPELWRKRCTEGIRSNIGDVLQAIICNNPYPSEQLDEKSWNQLVLKAFFTEKPVHQIIHLDARANQELANTLSEYAHERWAAGRTIHPLLWRSVGKFINESIFPDINRIANSENTVEREAAALACWDSHYEPAKKLLDIDSNLKSAIEKGELTWNTIVQRINNQ